MNYPIDKGCGVNYTFLGMLQKGAVRLPLLIIVSN